jgi:hypothetical protein
MKSEHRRRMCFVCFLLSTVLVQAQGTPSTPATAAVHPI